VSVATQTRGLIDDANALLKETYPLVKNPKLFISAISDCKKAMSGMLVDIFHNAGLTFSSVPEEFGPYKESAGLGNDERVANAIKSHDYASSLLCSYAQREVDFFRNDAYYVIEENNALTKIDFESVMMITKSAMELYEVWYEKWKNH
jgi:hypothetical protein